MQNTIPFRTQKPLEYDSLFLASVILMDVHRTIRNVQMIVAVLLGYALIGASIADHLVGWIAFAKMEKNGRQNQIGESNGPYNAKLSS